MAEVVQSDSRTGVFGLVACLLAATGGLAAEPAASQVLTWSLRDDVRAGAGRDVTLTLQDAKLPSPPSFENRVSVPDLHATILHQLGIDHTRLTYLHNGRPERLTDPDVTGAKVVRELLT